MKRSPLKRTKPMKRGKRLGPGKKTVAMRKAMRQAIDDYFTRYGWEDGTRWFCQVTGLTLYREDAVPHHKTPRSELRKAGVKDLDAPHRLIICHWAIHKAFVHSNQMGRPKGVEEARRFEVIEKSEANAMNGMQVVWENQDEFDFQRFMGGK